MDGRRLYQSEGIAEKCILPCEGSPRAVLCAAPIIAAGDVTGVVALLTEDRTATPDAAQLKAVNVAAAFLARQMEEERTCRSAFLIIRRALSSFMTEL